jgi:hypothetical protein
MRSHGARRGDLIDYLARTKHIGGMETTGLCEHIGLSFDVGWIDPLE